MSSNRKDKRFDIRAVSIWTTDHSEHSQLFGNLQAFFFKIMFDRKQWSSVKQLSFNKKNKLKRYILYINVKISAFTAIQLSDLVFLCHVVLCRDFPGGSDGKGICLRCRRLMFSPWAGKIPWRRDWHPTLVLLPGESQGRRSLVGYSPWGRKESDTTEWLKTAHDFLCLQFHFCCPKTNKQTQV